MNLIDKLVVSMAQKRGFVIGSGVVERADTLFGKSGEEFGPESYGNYIATSNGVYACATSRADYLASLQLRLYNGFGDQRTEVEKGALYDLMYKVNPFWTMNRLMNMTELSLCLWGEAFWFLERGQSGKQPPQEIWWGKPSSVTVIPHDTQYISGFSYQPKSGGQPIPFDVGEVIWFRMPNPIDEYEGLSPLAAARLGADYATDAMRANRLLFTNGMNMGGALFPKAGSILTKEQASELEESLSRRFKGVDKMHKWGVFRFEADMKEFGISPKDAEFLGGQKLALEDICRAYRWPLDLVGGQRTYENYNAAQKAAWTNAVLPEGRFIASELTEQLLPLFPNEADYAEFDSSDIEVLQDDQNANWAREKEQIACGALLINEWREDQGLKAVPWGDAWWASVTLQPIREAEAPEPPAPEPMPEAQPEEDPELEEEEAEAPERGMRMVEFGGTEHERLWNTFIRRTEPHEKAFSKMCIELFKRQQTAVIARLKAAERKQPTMADVASDPFKKSEWVRKFREASRPLLQIIIREAGEAALLELGIELGFDALDPNVIRFLERRAQRFAREVNDTTWNNLRGSLMEGIEAGESIEELSERVEVEMGARIQSTPETIARTEVIGASNGGTLLSWEQSGVVEKKAWLAALDDRTRTSHIDAHTQYQSEPIPLEDDFQVGAGSGPAPGQIGLAEEDINCRCTMIAVIKE